MGREAKTTLIDKDGRADVRAHLDSQTLLITGARKLSVPLALIKAAKVEGEELNISAPSAKFSLLLGAKEATKWQENILKPPMLADKLGVKSGRTVMLVGSLPPEVVEAVGKAKTFATMPLGFGCDITIIMLPTGYEIAHITAAAKALPRGRTLWFVYEKGKPFNGDDVISAARKVGLKDTKVARISQTHAGLRFVK